MELFIYAVVGLSLTWGLYVAYMTLATRAAEGRSARPLFDALPQTTQQARSLVYCFSPQCAPCRPMSKEVDSLIAGGMPVFKLDISHHPQLSQELGIRATPTLILVEDGTVSRLYLGVRTAGFMRDLLDMPHDDSNA